MITVCVYFFICYRSHMSHERLRIWQVFWFQYSLLNWYWFLFIHSSITKVIIIYWAAFDKRNTINSDWTQDLCKVESTKKNTTKKNSRATISMPSYKEIWIFSY